MHIPDRAKKIWNDWDSRAFVLLSLFLQIVLIFCGKLRKRNNSRLVSLIVWSAYLLADWVATFALGILSNKRKVCYDPQNINGDLQAFWAPFLLLHLGGPDTITAFSIEDNELWLRHMLGLVFQVAVAIYVFVGSLDCTKLLAPALLMFLAGIIKYSEKSWALMCASMENMRKSTYAKIMVDKTSIFGLEEFFTEGDQSQQQGLGKFMLPSTEDDDQYISQYFFPTLKHLIVDLVLTIPEHNKSQSFFLQLHPPRAFKVIDIELSFLYEMLYTKSTAIHTTLGPFLRCITFSCIFSSLLIFRITERHSHGETDVVITYLLLGGAFFLEVYSVGLLVFSDWAVLRLKRLSRLSNMIFSIMPCFHRQSRPRWSNSMAQYNLITFCLKDRPSAFRSFMDFLSVKEVWYKFWHTKSSFVTDELKEFIFDVLKRESSRAKDSKDYTHFSTCRGKHALKNIEGKHNIRELVKSVEVEFDQSILLWHIASDLCYYQKDNREKDNREKDNRESDIDKIRKYRRIGKAVSDYMLYLLVDRPFMLPSRFGEIRYGTICVEAKNIFHHQFRNLDEKKACEKLLNDQNPISLSQLEESQIKSELLHAVTLATELQKLPIETRWKAISNVWVEMLCYAATHCRGIFHAKQLSAGGELLTMVWLLMAHLGIGQQYMTEENQATRTSIIIG